MPGHRKPFKLTRVPEVPPADASEMLVRLSREWDELAEADALWAVLSAPDRKGGRWTIEEFLASGEQEIREGLDSAHAEYGLPYRRDRALDFGCGAGDSSTPSQVVSRA